QTYGPGVAKAQSHETGLRRQLSAAEGVLAKLEKVTAKAANERQKLETERDAYLHQRTAAETQLATAKDKLGGQGPETHAMGRLTPKDREETVTGAILGFARTLVRPEVRESMDGNVQLQFPDSDGRLRVCRHDTLTEQWHTGDLASCLRNQSGHAATPYHRNYQLTTMTIEAWFKWEGTPDEIGFLTSRGMEELEIHTAGNGGPGSLRFIPVPGVFIDTAPNAITPGEWTHVACVFREKLNTGEIYINGVAATHMRQDIKRKRAPTSSGFHVGCRSGGRHKLRGQLQELRLWNVALSADEIRGGMHFEASGHEPGLVGYWPMTDGKGPTARDLSSAANHATLYGAEFYPAHTPIGRVIGGKALSFGPKGKATGLGAVDIANKSFTVELWARCTSGGPVVQGLLLQGAEAHNSCLHLVFMPGKKFSFRFYGNDLDLQEATDTRWHHWACVYDRAKNLRTIYRDGVQVAQDQSVPYTGSGHIELGHWHFPDTSFQGLMSDVRIWSLAKSQTQIQQAMHRRLRGDEPGLQAYYKLDGLVAGKLRDRTGAAVGTIVDTNEVQTEDLPLGNAEALVSGEYGSVEQASGKKVALLRRQYAWLNGGEVQYAASQRVDTLEMRWLGNAQMKPTLVGYIEGAPPVPSENLTVEADYRGASSVEFKISESVATTYNQTFSTGLDNKLAVEAGTATNTGGGVAIIANAFEIAQARALYQGKLNLSARGLWNFARSGTTSIATSDKLTLKGNRETKAQYPSLGLRYEPKNVGYATIISTLADIFVIRLQNSKRVVSYRVLPVKDIPPDISTVTFMINPAYTKNGTLDGQIGSKSAPGDVYRHVAKARAQYGSAVDASYFRLREAYALRDAIERSNRSTEALAVNLRADLLGQTKQNHTVSTGNTTKERSQQEAGAKSQQGQSKIDKQQEKLKLF
ncbi:MAG: LamG-like jellyroll fold domain-containing protein, partial [Nannocystaceae bacterium]